MRARLLRRGLGASSGSGSTANQSVNAACAGLTSIDPAGVDNQSIANAVQSCGQAILIADPTLNQSFSTAMEQVLEKALAQAAAGAAEAVSLDLAISLISSAGAAFLQDVMDAIIAEIIAIIEAAAADLGITVTLATTTGAASFGYVGAIVGFIIGATVGIVNYIEATDATVQITNGGTYKVSDYAQTNLPNAQTWLTQQTTLAGVTCQYFANLADLFLANAYWLWSNQVLTGMCQPVPPSDLGSGDGVDYVFTTCPGAFELLSRAQYAEAAWLLALTPTKLPFYASVPKPTGTSPTANPANNPNNYNPVFSQADLYGSPGWTPDNPAQDPTTLTGTGVWNPDSGSADVMNFTWPVRNASLNPTTINSSACQSGNATSGATGIAVQSSNPNPGIGYAPYTYSSCPNLCTNNNTTDASGKVTGQTDIAEGIYALQQIYPALTTNQCLILFNANFNAYATAVAAAQDWANSLCTKPTAAELGTGSKWNLEPVDVNRIIAAWTKPKGTCVTVAPSQVLATGGTTTTPTSTASTIVKGALAAAGVGGVALGAYAYSQDISFGEAGARALAKLRGLL